mmetsp:Transcript_99272/g.284001  ORF Transcript_99272/g.284001 Transcript_99272/m.284001 type:complete len:322 (+) Transcript_99272:3186-4151(+)
MTSRKNFASPMRVMPESDSMTPTRAPEQSTARTLAIYSAAAAACSPRLLDVTPVTLGAAKKTSTEATWSKSTWRTSSCTVRRGAHEGARPQNNSRALSDESAPPMTSKPPAAVTPRSIPPPARPEKKALTGARIPMDDGSVFVARPVAAPSTALPPAPPFPPPPLSSTFSAPGSLNDAPVGWDWEGRREGGETGDGSTGAAAAAKLEGEGNTPLATSSSSLRSRWFPIRSDSLPPILVRSWGTFTSSTTTSATSSAIESSHRPPPSSTLPSPFSAGASASSTTASNSTTPSSTSCVAGHLSRWPIVDLLRVESSHESRWTS